MIHINLRVIEFYACFMKVYSAAHDTYCARQISLRIGTKVFRMRKSKLDLGGFRG